MIACGSSSKLFVMCKLYTFLQTLLLGAALGDVRYVLWNNDSTGQQESFQL